MPKCEIHGTELQSSTCEIRYGLPPGPPKGYFDAERDLFPNAFSWIMGGCVIDGPDVRPANVEFCSTCRAARTKWGADNSVTGFWES
ncbi:MAG: hypothetical protein ABJA02_15615 [Acidobacteriota bacterium]